MKVNRSRKHRHTAFTKTGIIIALFILLILASQVASEALQQAVLNYYLEGRSSPVDGMVASCYRVWKGYILTDDTAFMNTTLCPVGGALGFPFYYRVNNSTVVPSVPGIVFYPIYKTESMFLFRKTNQNFTAPLNIFGLGRSSDLDTALRSSLIAGSLPSDQHDYQTIITDFTANRYGLKVGDRLEISGVYKDYGGQVNATIFSKSVYVSGILSESKLDDELNIAGVPIFSAASSVGGTATAVALGVSPSDDFLCRGSPIYTLKTLNQSPYFPSEPNFCQAWPKLFAIVSNNLMLDLYGFNVTGPSEILFRFSNPPKSPNEFLAPISQIQNVYANSYYVSLAWRSHVSLIESGTFHSLSVFDNATEIGKREIVQDGLLNGLEVGLQVSPVVDRLGVVRSASTALAAGAVVLGLTTEVAVFILNRRKMIVEIEIYKANGLTLWPILKLQLGIYFRDPLKWIGFSALVTVSLGVTLGVSALLPLILASIFLSTILCELVLLTYTTLSFRTFRYLRTGRAG